MRCGVHKLVADVALLAGTSVLLVRYHDTRAYDGQEGWFLPDAYLGHLEHPDDAAVRIVHDQTGIQGSALRLGFIESFDGEGGPWHLVFHYRAELAAPLPVGPRGNVLAAEWFPLDELPDRGEVAHDGWALDVITRLTGAAG